MMRLLIFFLFGALSCTAVIGHEQAVIALQSDNFEHATQAATGQTTGNWFVYFGKEDDSLDQQLWRAFAEQQREGNPWVIHAFVDVENNPDLAQRFGITTTPAFILFRNRKMFRFSSFATAMEPALIDALADFSTSGWKAAKGESVPQDRLVKSGISTLSVLAIIAGAALLLLFAALLGDPLLKYFNAAKPVPIRGDAKTQ